MVVVSAPFSDLACCHVLLTLFWLAKQRNSRDFCPGRRLLGVIDTGFNRVNTETFFVSALFINLDRLISIGLFTLVSCMPMIVHTLYTLCTLICILRRSLLLLIAVDPYPFLRYAHILWQRSHSIIRTPRYTVKSGAGVARKFIAPMVADGRRDL